MLCWSQSVRATKNTHLHHLEKTLVRQALFLVALQNETIQNKL